MVPFLLLLIVAELGVVIYLVGPAKPKYSVTVKETSMPVGTVTPGTPATFQAVLNENGSPIALPAGSVWTWTSDDTNATLTPSPDSTTVTVSLPITDTTTSIAMTASTTTPTGTTVSGSITVPVQAGAATFTVTVTQLS